MIQAHKKSVLVLFVLFMVILSSFSASSAENSALRDHPSAYLSMHSDDPVQWQLWGEDIFAKARAENKLIYMSIGYFSCHWCHVMQQESYKDKQVGAFLNKHFVVVKVDRELRPELDRRMLRFVEQLRGQAGWPLNVFITADGYPVTGFTYLPRDSFLQVLEELDSQWQRRKAEIGIIARQYFTQTETSKERSTLMTLPVEGIDKLAEFYLSQTMSLADELQGGFGESLKFPSYPQLNALIKMIQLNPSLDSDVVAFVKLTLDSMASFNLMDHLNNGFFRYSTDPDWETPHFEKMLYDNAQLAALYLDAESLWPGMGYAEIGLRTIEFMVNYLADEAGGYNASLSAVDEANIEGAGYFWTQSELRGLLTDEEFSHLQAVWALDEGNTEAFQLAPLIGIGSLQESASINIKIRDKLAAVKKPLMPVDNKRLASWNALVLIALVKAQRFDTGQRMEALADDLFDYIRKNFIDYHPTQGIAVIRFAGQQQSAETTLEDYAQLALALQHYGLKKADRKAETMAHDLVEAAFERFYREGRWIQDTQSLIPGDQGELIIQDAVLSSPSSVLLETAYLMREPSVDILKKSQQLIPRLTQDVLDAPFYYGSSITLGQLYRRKMGEKKDSGSTL